MTARQCPSCGGFCKPSGCERLNTKDTERIHSCSYHCHLPGCIKAQRDELRDKYFRHEEQISKLTEMLEIQQKMHETAVSMLKPAADVMYQKGYAEALNEATRRVGEMRGFGKTTQDSFAVFLQGLKK